ncbi:MAG TPA: GntR family transcriptional regulator [Rhodopila sp.]|uniref:GntR family transcriptional regulator n=1 Tax=Rhodopila sp. TaxID=2480087 RepID=UPI002B975687|nr:GntR family transcriptional regulator [Rhodopila sp.]HVY17071.1 GntR family transcriptional regulator [Rhodopila sp.]
MQSMPIDTTSAVPLYAQVEALLAANIESGQLQPGTQLPPEDSLIARFSVSRTTIRAAVQNLARRGLVEIRRGRGTFVSRPKLTQELSGLTGFVEDMQALGKQATARLIDKQVLPATEAVAEHLKLEPGVPVVRIRRVRLADGVPMSLDETYLPHEVGVKVMADDLEVDPIFTLLEQKYDLPLTEADYRLEAIAANSDVAVALCVPLGSPIFLVERTSFCADRRPIDYERLHYRGDQISFVTRLARRRSQSI